MPRLPRLSELGCGDKRCQQRQVLKRTTSRDLQSSQRARIMRNARGAVAYFDSQQRKYWPSRLISLTSNSADAPLPCFLAEQKVPNIGVLLTLRAFGWLAADPLSFLVFSSPYFDTLLTFTTLHSALHSHCHNH